MKARVKFTKEGTMKFVGHLDLMRFFQKAFRRSQIPIAYSQGFSPHQLFTFASPLGVGVTSDGEYMDIQFTKPVEPEDILKQINQGMNEEIHMISFHVLPEKAGNAMSVVAAADYVLSLKDGYDIPDNFETCFHSFMNQDEILIQKKTKKSEKEVNIKPLIYHYAFTKEDFVQKTGRNFSVFSGEIYKNEKKVYMQTAAGSVKNLKPDLVLEAFYSYMEKEFSNYAYQIHRLELYGDSNYDEKKEEAEERNLISLDSFDIERKASIYLGKEKYFNESAYYNQI